MFFAPPPILCNRPIHVVTSEALASWYLSRKCVKRGVDGRSGRGQLHRRTEELSLDLEHTHPMLPAVALAVPCKHRGWLDTFLSPVDVHVDSPESACTSNSSRDGAEQLVHP